MKRILFAFLLLVSLSVKSETKSDTIKCYVQIMIPAEGALGISKQIENNHVYMNGGLLIYTKAYAIKDNEGKFIKFLNSKRKELNQIWKPKDPQVMIYEW